MALQQIISLALVAAAALYLGRALFRAARSFLSGKGDCSEGCGKCAFAAPASKPVNRKKPAPDFIPLAGIKDLTKRK